MAENHTTAKVTREEVASAYSKALAARITDDDLALLTKSLAAFHAKRRLQNLRYVVALDWDDLDANQTAS